MRKLKKQIRFWLPVVLWASVIFAFSAMPTNKTSDFYLYDFILKKSAHVIEYGIFTALIYRALKENGVSKKRAAYTSIIIAVLYGISDEYHQSFTPGRTPKARDVVFDTIGAILAIYTIWKLLPKAPKRLRNLANALQLI